MPGFAFDLTEEDGFSTPDFLVAAATEAVEKAAVAEVAEGGASEAAAEETRNERKSRSKPKLPEEEEIGREDDAFRGA